MVLRKPWFLNGKTALCEGGRGPFHDGGKNSEHSVVAEFVHRDDVEMTNESRSEIISAASGGSHRPHQLNVYQMHSRLVFAVVPIPMT